MSISSHPPLSASKEQLHDSQELPAVEVSTEKDATTLQTIAKISTTIKNFLTLALSKEKSESAELSPQEKELIAKAADTLFCTGGAFDLSGTEAGIHLYLENYFQNQSPEKRRLLHMMFSFLEVSPLIFGPRRTLLTNLTPSERAEALDFSNKRLYLHRVALQSLRFLLTLGYMNHPEIQKKIGCQPNQNPFNLK